MNIGDDESRAAESVSLDEMRVLVRLVLWAALIAVGGLLSFPALGVSVSMQTFFVLLAGLVEGPKIAAAAAGLYLLAGILGLPVFVGGVGGPAILLKPSAGYALAFPLQAAIAGLANRAGQKGRGPLSFGRALAVSILASVVLHFFGFIGIVINAKIVPAAAAKMILTFVPGDLAKCAAAASIASSRFFLKKK